MKILIHLFVLSSTCLMVMCAAFIHVLSNNLSFVRGINMRLVRYLTTTILALHTVIVFCLFGCWAAIVCVKKMTMMYIISTLLLVVIMMVCMFYFNDITDTKQIRKHLNIMQYTGRIKSDISYEIDMMQFQYKCCGMDSYKEYEGAVQWVYRDTQKIPVSCCPQADRMLSMDPSNLIYINCHTMPLVNNSFISRGCLELVKGDIDDVAERSTTYYICSIAFQILNVLLGVLYLQFYKQDIKL